MDTNTPQSTSSHPPAVCLSSSDLLQQGPKGGCGVGVTGTRNMAETQLLQLMCRCQAVEHSHDHPFCSGGSYSGNSKERQLRGEKVKD